MGMTSCMLLHRAQDLSGARCAASHRSALTTGTLTCWWKSASPTFSMTPSGASRCVWNVHIPEQLMQCHSE